MIKEIICHKIYQTILEAKNILLVTHYDPDGDAAASLSAMAQVLKFLKKDYTAFCADDFEDKLSFLPGLKQVIKQEQFLAFDSFDLIITLDCGTLSRSRLAKKITERKAKQKLIEIDHHEPLERVADLALRLNDAASTTEVIYDWLKINNLPISPALAEAILFGLMTDTGNFVYSATSEKTLAIASEMLSRGANWPKLIRASKTKADLATTKLWGLALSRLKINQRYQVAFTVLTQVDFKNLQVSNEVTDGLPGFLSRLSDVQAVLVLKEESNGVIKGSWRACQDGINVAKLCNKLGGGGHAKAAGFQMTGQIKQVGNSWSIQ